MGQEGQIGDLERSKFDAATNAVVRISDAHKETHDGNHFVVSEVNSLDDTNTREYLVTTPNTTKWSHFMLTVIGSLDTKIDVYEDTTKTGGTGLTEHNRNRNSSTTATTTVAHTPSGAGDGTLIFTMRFGHDTLSTALGGIVDTSRGENEWVLKQNAKYLIRITSNTDGNNITSILNWYELTNKN